MMNNEMIKKLEDRGFRRWQKGSYDRLYINAENLGLELSFYNTGNISGAHWHGNSISHAEGGRMRYAKTYIDVETGKVYSQHEWLQEAAEAILNEVENEMAQAQVQVQDAEETTQEESTMKTRTQWIEEAQLEIAGLQDAGIEVTREAVEEELRQNYLDQEIKTVIDAEGGIEEYLEILWGYIEAELSKEKIWYAVIDEDSEYGNDWGYGSEDLETAKKMARELEVPTAYIAVIDVTDDDPMCIGEIHLED